MKTTSILTYAAAASLIAFLVSLIVTQDALMSSAMFAATAATLITLHDYAPRNYFVVTSQPTRATLARQSIPAFSHSVGVTRRKSATRRIAVSA